MTMHITEISSVNGKKFVAKNMYITETDALYDYLSSQRLRLEQRIYFKPTFFYIETSDGKLFLKLDCEGIIAFNEYCSTYVQSDYKYVTCNVVCNKRKLFNFLKKFLWSHVYVKMTPNGLFLFVEFEDPYYYHPEYKLYNPDDNNLVCMYQ
jgi:hypothetical protein